MKSPLNLVIQDPTFLVLWKPAGLKVYRDEKKEPKQAKELLESQLGEIIYPVHRLDKDTEGLVLFARDPKSATDLINQFKRRRIEKSYQALVWGAPTSPKGAFTASLPKNKTPSIKEPAQTEFQLIRTLTDHKMTWLKLHPRTGRFHQIRRHLIGGSMPIVGDTIYGDKARDAVYFASTGKPPRLHLWATDLAFYHPQTMRRVEAHKKITASD